MCSVHRFVWGKKVWFIPWMARTLGTSLIHHLFPLEKVWFHSQWAFPFLNRKRNGEVLCLLCRSVFFPAVFLIAASQLLSYMFSYSGVRGQVKSPSPDVPEVEAGDRVVAVGWHSHILFPGLGERRWFSSSDLCTHVWNRSSKNEIKPQILVEIDWLLDLPYIKRIKPKNYLVFSCQLPGTSSTNPVLNITVLDNVPWTAANWNVPRTVTDQTHFIKYVLVFLSHLTVRGALLLSEIRRLCCSIGINWLASWQALLQAGSGEKGLTWASEAEKWLAGGPDDSTYQSNPAEGLSEGGKSRTRRTAGLLEGCRAAAASQHLGCMPWFLDSTTFFKHGVL